MMLRMPSDRPILLGAPLALVLILCGAAADPAADQEGRDPGTLVVTSDSSAYCRTLSGAINAYGTLPRAIRELKAQGEGMCGEGQVRGGIARLRRALLALGGDERPPGGKPPESRADLP